MNQYLLKFGFQKPVIVPQPSPDLGITVVIPCFNEPDIITSIESLKNSTRPSCDVEVIVVINHGEHHEATVVDQNIETLKILKDWNNKNEPFFKLYILTAFNLPKKHAGVGLARKIGMDEAVARYSLINTDGLIVCFDADATCDKNYFIEIEKHFDTNTKSPGAAIRYEHPIKGNQFNQHVYEGIINYELFLRYYNQGLQFARLPFAFHTVGSSMVVRSSAYQKQGGMNKRKAGEDFYFLHKIIALGNFSEINTTKVIPSPRTSDRVPFGTGKAISDWIENQSDQYYTYDVRIWEILKAFAQIIPKLQTKEIIETDFYQHPVNKYFLQFLEQNGFSKSLVEIRSNSTNNTSFIKRFFVWFNAFRILKLVHFLRDVQFPNQPIFEAAKTMAQKRGFYDRETDVKSLLIAYRRYEAQA